MPKRPPIPAELEREILLEAGHRCAIHTCRQTPLEVAHIVPWTKCRKHDYENLIALCPTCHTRFDRGEIDRKSMVRYKSRLLIYSGRLTELEFRLLHRLAGAGTTELWWLADLDSLIDGLIREGYLADSGQRRRGDGSGYLEQRLYLLTANGQGFASRFLSQLL